MAQLDDSESAMTIAIMENVTTVAYANLAMGELRKIMIAKQRYDATRLSAGGDPLACLDDEQNDAAVHA